MSTKDRYVAGFMFSESKGQVALIRKQKPVWQRGKLNGIGGKIEAAESAVEAMIREFEEETGCATPGCLWAHFLSMHGTNEDGREFEVEFFATIGDLPALESREEEKLELIQTSEINPLRRDMIENLPWLICMALDHLEDGRPSFCTARYGKEKTK